jgi:3-oxoacyl-[acyl-carrier protein] reductase
MGTQRTTLRRFDLTDRIAVVTGAGSGIGRASAVLLAEAGALVVCMDRNADAVQTAAAGIGAPSYAESVDVTEREAVQSLITRVADRHGRLDILVNAAGIADSAPVVEITDAHFDAIMAVNFRGVLYCCQAAARVMAEQGFGSIVNVASRAIDDPLPTLAAYSISKAAVGQLTRVLAKELAPHGVRVNAVNPGRVLTGMTSRHFVRPDGSIDQTIREQVLQSARDSNALGVVAEPEDIAYDVFFLASDASAYTTGQFLRPNGGSPMNW